MNILKRSLLIIVLLAFGATALAQEAAPWSIIPERESTPAPLGLSDRDALGLPGMRPRLTMSIPLDGRQAGESADSSFSWSLETWQLNTASLAHIQCQSGQLTVDSYLAQDCRFVDQPVPEHSVNLVQVRGDWMPARGLTVGLGAFHGQSETSPMAALQRSTVEPIDLSQMMIGPASTTPAAVEGLDVNVSFGIQTERVGDFLLGLQVARYRQRMSLADLGLSLDPWTRTGLDAPQYGNSAQVVVGWSRGSLSGEMLGHHREVPFWLRNEAGNASLNSFDLEFSWQALRNASISVGVSNLLDASPNPEDAASEPRLEDPMESVYGRIPYVRYKHDL